MLVHAVMDALAGAARLEEIVALLERYGVKACYYGHLHGGSHRLAREGRIGTVDYFLVSADYLRFEPKIICKT